MKKYLYENGKGKDVPIKDLVEKRNKERAEKQKTESEQQGIKSMLSSTKTAIHFNPNGASKM